METLCHLHSIYRGTEGEGINIGMPQVFVRFQGCAIGCLNCDSMETWDFEAPLKLSFEQILDEIRKEGFIHRVSITGGDPLHPKHVPSVTELSKFLKSHNFDINLEASGSRIVHEIFDIVDFISFDCKTPSTGVKTPEKLILKLDEQYSTKSQIKSVIADERDFKFVKDLKEKLEENDRIKTPWVLTPCFNTGEDFNPELSQMIFEANYKAGSPFRVIGQQHKFIYGSKSLRI